MNVSTAYHLTDHLTLTGRVENALDRDYEDVAGFGTVHITGSTANGSAIGSAGGVTQIIMIDGAGRDKDTVSGLTSGENFSATWLRSN